MCSPLKLALTRAKTTADRQLGRSSTGPISTKTAQIKLPEPAAPSQEQGKQQASGSKSVARPRQLASINALGLDPAAKTKSLLGL